MTILFFNPLQIQNLKKKKWGDTSPVSPTKLRPCMCMKHNTGFIVAETVLDGGISFACAG